MVGGRAVIGPSCRDSGRGGVNGLLSWNAQLCTFAETVIWVAHTTRPLHNPEEDYVMGSLRGHIWRSLGEALASPHNATRQH